MDTAIDGLEALDGALVEIGRLAALNVELLEVLKAVHGDHKLLWDWGNALGIGKDEYDRRSAVIKSVNHVVAKAQGEAR